jgi:hypothetical protein
MTQRAVTSHCYIGDSLLRFSCKVIDFTLTFSIFPVCVVNYISVYKSGRLRTLFFDDSFIPLLDLKPLHVSAVL